MANRLQLDRAEIAKIAQGVPKTIMALERFFTDTVAYPSTIEEANALAGQALAVAQAALSLLVTLTEAIEQLESAPAPVPHVEQDDVAPRAHLGTMASQSADQVEITGGSVDGTPIGATEAAAGSFTTLAAANGFGCNSQPPQDAVTLGDAATDLASVITLANNIRTALIANGIGA